MLNVTVDGIIYQLQSRGGISRLYSELLPRMCDRDLALRVDLLSPNGSVQPLPQHSRITPHPISSINTVRFPSQAKTISNGILRQLAIGTGRGKIWHSTYYTRPRFWKGKQVVMVMDMIQELYPQLFQGPHEDAFRAQKRRCVLDADIILSISDVTRDDVHRLYGVELEKIVTVPLAHSSIFHADLSIPTSHAFTDRPFLLYVGRRSHNKNFSALARAYAAWRQRGEVDLVVVGENWSEEEKNTVTALGIAQSVHIVGSVDDQELSRLYHSAAAYVYPSLYEGFGIPLLEAMACGCPVIASRIPSTLEVAGDFPIYFDLNHQSSFVDALETALSEGRKTPRTQQAQTHAERFSWDVTAEKVLAIYRDLLS